MTTGRSVGASPRSGPSCGSAASRPTRPAPAGAGRVGRRPAPHRPPAAARRRVRLHRRGAEDERTLAPTARRSPAPPSGPGCCGTSVGRPGHHAARPARCRCRWCWRPPGFTRIADPEGELAVARAAQRAGLPYTLSTLSTRSIEEVPAVSDGPLWFQVYVWRDRGLVQRDGRPGRSGATRRSSSPSTPRCWAGASATCGAASRCRRRSGRARWSTAPCTPAGPGRSCAPSRSASPTWWAARSATASDAVSRCRLHQHPVRPGLSWDDVEWLRSVWDGPLVLKGIQTVDDAVLAAERGVDAIALSNHGGRQLDSRAGAARPGGPGGRGRSAAGSRSSATAACAGAATSSRPWPSAPGPAWPGAPTSTAWGRRRAGRRPRARAAGRRPPAHDGAGGGARWGRPAPGPRAPSGRQRPGRGGAPRGRRPPAGEGRGRTTGRPGGPGGTVPSLKPTTASMRRRGEGRR